ncbi:MAG: hypothetical protein ACYDBJ_26795, partial [Aggregatilineales bacterium]
LALLAGLAFPTYAQSAAGSNAQNSGDFQVELTITGPVQAVSQNTLTLNGGLVIVIPPGVTLPPGIAPGVIVTVTVQVGDNNFIAITVVIGTATATPSDTPTAEPTDEFTSTPIVTPTGTIVTGTATTLACGSDNVQPVAQRLALFFKVSYTEIMNWHCLGFGFGEIARAYALALATANTTNPVTAAQIFALRQSGLGWGQIMKQFNVAPRQLAPGIAIRGGGNGGPEPESTKGKGHGDGNGNDNGNGSDNGNGNGHDK